MIGTNSGVRSFASERLMASNRDGIETVHVKDQNVVAVPGVEPIKELLIPAKFFRPRQVLALLIRPSPAPRARARPHCQAQSNSMIRCTETEATIAA